MRKILIPLFILFLISACTKKSETLKTGMWRATLELQGQELPFNFEIVKDNEGGFDAYIINADERLLLDEINIKDDSVTIALHVFDADIKAKINDETLSGIFIKNYEKDYRVPFKAQFGETHRFEKEGATKDTVDFSGKYEVVFTNDSDTTLAIGVFNQINDSVTGTFLTPVGDYRYLQGNVVNNELWLSTFDGNHSYIFSATKNEDGRLTGTYLSGKTWKQNWTGVKNENATLPDAESLTFLKPGYEKIEFAFPDVEGKTVSLNDEKYKNKVVILQLFGTWCPNCMDETKFLSPWYQQNKERGVEVVGIAFERKTDFDYASGRVKKMIEKFDVPYQFVIAPATDNKEDAAKALPMLNKLVAFPTMIFIGKDGKVKKIHTGFSGPGTGVYYTQFVQHFNETVNELLSENFASK